VTIHQTRLEGKTMTTEMQQDALVAAANGPATMRGTMQPIPRDGPSAIDSSWRAGHPSPPGSSLAPQARTAGLLYLVVAVFRAFAQLSWLWLFAIGLLGYRSGVFPRALSVLLMLGTVCYVVDALLRFLAPDIANVSANVFVLPEILSEVSLLAYLLVKGVRTAPPNTATLTTR
jgi:uncharacterized protein DUF4386